MVLNPDFEFRLALHVKRDKTFNYQITKCFEKCVFSNDIKYRHIIYRCKVFLPMSMNSRSLPQNKTMFGSIQLEKFESVQTIQALSLLMEDTIGTRRSSWSWSCPWFLSKWPEEADPSLSSFGIPHAPRPGQTLASGPPTSWDKGFQPPLASGGQCVGLDNGSVGSFWGRPWAHSVGSFWERKRLQKKEVELTEGRERGWWMTMQVEEGHWIEDRPLAVSEMERRGERYEGF